MLFTLLVTASVNWESLRFPFQFFRANSSSPVKRVKTSWAVGCSHWSVGIIERRIVHLSIICIISVDATEMRDKNQWSTSELVRFRISFNSTNSGLTMPSNYFLFQMKKKTIYFHQLVVKRRIGISKDGLQTLSKVSRKRKISSERGLICYVILVLLWHYLAIVIG